MKFRCEYRLMGFLDLLLVALIPVIKVLFITGVGLFLALDHVNLLGPDARNHLNKVSLCYFTQPRVYWFVQLCF